MTKDALLKKIETVLDDLQRNRAWGTIEIEIRDGIANMMGPSLNEKLIPQENTREQRFYR